jgi:hypothetical protein
MEYPAASDSSDQDVECPRCGMRRGLMLHRVTSSDAQECPKCWEEDGVVIPMAFYPPGSIEELNWRTENKWIFHVD